MIVVPGHNQLGNVLHLVIGPESEFFIDLHGAKVMDLTDVLQSLNGTNERIFLCYTRTQSEPATEYTLTQGNIPHKSSFTGTPMCDKPDCAVANGTKAADSSDMPAQAQRQQHAGIQTGKCAYCEDMKPLLPIIGFNICMSCAQIELGLNRAAKQVVVAQESKADA